MLGVPILHLKRWRNALTLKLIENIFGKVLAGSVSSSVSRAIAMDRVEIGRGAGAFEPEVPGRASGGGVS